MIAAERDRTPAQIALRWQLQLGLVPIPKTSQRRRMTENLDVFDFELDGDDLKAIAAMDSAGGRTGPDPATAALLF